MANRAYLFATNFADRWNWREYESQDEQMGNYWDSRHNIPIAWWFFFQSGEAFLVPIEGWHEVRLRTEKMNGIERFVERRQILEDIVAQRIPHRVFDFTVASIERLPGKFLALDPSEVAQDDETLVCAEFNQILDLISNENSSQDEFLAAARKYSDTDPNPHSPADPTGSHAITRIAGACYHDCELWQQIVVRDF